MFPNPFGRNKKVPRILDESTPEDEAALAKQYHLEYPWPGIKSGKTYAEIEKNGHLSKRWSSKRAWYKHHKAHSYMPKKISGKPRKKINKYYPKLVKGVEDVTKKMRLKRGLTYNKMQKLTGIDRRRYRRWEDGYAKCTPEEEVAIQNVFLPDIFNDNFLKSHRKVTRK